MGCRFCLHQLILIRASPSDVLTNKPWILLRNIYVFSMSERSKRPKFHRNVLKIVFVQQTNLERSVLVSIQILTINSHFFTIPRKAL